VRLLRGHGRKYGGGIHELEPREAETLPMPAPALADPDLILALALDRLVHAVNIEKAHSTTPIKPCSSTASAGPAIKFLS
jgi:hypothetical protein